MGVVQKFQWSWPQGVTPIEFGEWIDALPDDEKQKCLAGQARQFEMRQQAIDRGDMIMIDGGYAWKDKETAIKGKGVDEVWEKYWLRWQAETGVVFSEIFENK